MTWKILQNLRTDSLRIVLFYFLFQLILTRFHSINKTNVSKCERINKTAILFEKKDEKNQTKNVLAKIKNNKSMLTDITVL